MGAPGLLRSQFVLSLLLIAAHLWNAEACSCEGFYCISDTEYQFCENGKTVGEPIPCDSGTVCGNGTNCSVQPICEEVSACTSEGIFSNKRNANLFYKCSFDQITQDWIKTEYACPIGSAFEMIMGMCIKVDEVNDEKMEDELYGSFVDEDVDVEHSDSSVIELACLHEGYFLNEENCESYFLCFGTGKGIQFNCPKGFYYDSQNQICTTEIPQRCQITDLPQYDVESSTIAKPQEESDAFQCPGVGYYPDVKNCRRFYQCDDFGQAFHLSCPYTTFFNNEISTCGFNLPEGCYLPIETPITSMQPPPITSGTQSPEVNEDEVTTISEDNTTNNRNDDRIPTEGPETEVPPDDKPAIDGPADDSVTLTSSGMTEEPVADDPTPARVSTIPQSSPIGTETPTEEEIKTEISSKTDTDHTDSLGSTLALPPDDTPEIATDGGNEFSSTEETETEMTSDGHVDNPITTLSPTKVTDNNNEDTETGTSSGDDPAEYTLADGLVSTIPSLYLVPTVPTHDNSIPTTIQNDDSTTYNPTKGNELASRERIPTRIMPSNIPDNSAEESTVNTTPSTTIATEVGDNKTDIENTNTNSEMPNEATNKWTTKGIFIAIKSRNPQRERPEFMCRTRGIFPDPKNCHRYWICFQEGFGFSVMCTSGAYFDEITHTCTAVKPQRCQLGYNKIPPTRSGFVCHENGIYADPLNCRKYYLCYGIPKHVTCHGNTFFNDDLKICQNHMPPSCLQMSTIPPTDHSTNDTLLTEDPPVTTEAPQASFTCVRPGKFAHPDNCRMFYECNYWLQAFLHICDGGKYFNDLYGHCDTRMTSRCMKNIGYATSSPPMFSDVIRFERGYFADGKNCQRYYYCSGATAQPIHLKCAEGMLFDIKKGMCQIPSNDFAGCGTEENDSSSHCSDVPDGVVCQLTAMNRVPNPRLSSVRNPGIGYEECPYGFYFDWEESRCISYLLSSFRREKLTSTMVFHLLAQLIGVESMSLSTFASSSTGEAFVCEYPGYYPDATDCKKYYLCSPSLMMFNYTCPRELYFNEITSLCSSKMSARCLTMMTSSTPSPTTTVTSSTVTSSSSVILPDITTSSVADTDVTSPDNDPETETTLEPEISSSATTMIATTSNAPTSSTEITPQSSTNPPNATFKCSSPGLFPDAVNCRRYHRCSPSLVDYLFTCPGKMYFNNITKKCSSKMPSSCGVM